VAEFLDGGLQACAAECGRAHIDAATALAEVLGTPMILTFAAWIHPGTVTCGW
jgi:hypothetical protein